MMNFETEKQSQNQRQVGRIPVRRNVAGTLSLVALVAGEKKSPHVVGMHLIAWRGLILNPNNSGTATKRCHCSIGDYMALVGLGIALWHDLAVLIIAGILASMIANWPNERE